MVHLSQYNVALLARLYGSPCFNSAAISKSALLAVGNSSFRFVSFVPVYAQQAVPRRGERRHFSGRARELRRYASNRVTLPAKAFCFVSANSL